MGEPGARQGRVTQDVTLECAGNGRAFHRPRASGIQWEYGAPEERGVLVAYLLRHFGDPEGR